MKSTEVYTGGPQDRTSFNFYSQQDYFSGNDENERH